MLSSVEMLYVLKVVEAFVTFVLTEPGISQKM